MLWIRCGFGLGLMVVVCIGCAEGQQKTDAETDGFAGPVKSVATSVTIAGAKWQQPDAPWLVMPILCRDCSYDPDGSKTLSGQMVDGKFVGQNIQLSRDASGRVTDKLSFQVGSEQFFQHEVFGPFGKTEFTFYQNGKPCGQEKRRYDGNGHESEWLSLDCEGKQQGREETRSDKDGQWTERTGWGKEGVMTSHETYDPETDLQHFTTFEEDGAVNLKWTFQHGKVISFWEPSDTQGQYGDSFTGDEGHGNVNSFQCHNDRTCDRSSVHYEYLNGDERNVTSAEWRNAKGELRFAAYMEYQVDTAHNWTSRRVSVISPELPERTLYETDSRTIEYWAK